jgi:tetratricopeptide (TPR) repeat protein
VSEEKRYTAAEAHRYFAIEFNGQTWNLLENEDRTKADDEMMIYCAHASCRHWLEAGTGVHHQRGEWMIARVYSVLDQAEAAILHADRCLELTEQYSDLMEDFDWAYAYEGIARANAIAGNRDKALEYIAKAEKAGDEISDAESKKFFVGDFDAGDWKGLR